MRAVPLGDSIASEGKGEYLYVEGRVLTTDGRSIPGAVIETWETDADGKHTYTSCRTPQLLKCSTVGFYDTQYAVREKPDYRGRLRADDEGRYGYRAIVPIAYPIPGDVRGLP